MGASRRKPVKNATLGLAELASRGAPVMSSTSFWRNPNSCSNGAWLLLRVLLACLIAAHGWVRFTGGGVVPFGEWLVSQGLPMGLAIAVTVTAVEVLGTPVFALGWFVPALSVVYSSIYAVGILM